MILMPLYYQSVRHLDPVQTGLLVAPTGIGVALTTRLASSLTDRIGSGRTALAGGLHRGRRHGPVHASSARTPPTCGCRSPA